METKDEIVSDEPKPLQWIGSSQKDIRELPVSVRSTFGYAIYQAQCGKKHAAAKPLKGFGGAAVLEVMEDDEGGTYRAIYTVKFADFVYVLHVFQKKSKVGKKTALEIIDKIKVRLKRAENHYAKYIEQRNKGEKD